METGCVYLIRNSANGMCYVGKSQYPNRRIRAHLQGIGGNLPLTKDVLEYGKHAFDVEIIAKEVSPTHLNALEYFFIREYDSLQPNGYNLSKGSKKIGLLPDETDEALEKAKSTIIRLVKKTPGIHRRKLQQRSAGCGTFGENYKIALSSLVRDERIIENCCGCYEIVT